MVPSSQAESSTGGAPIAGPSGLVLLKDGSSNTPKLQRLSDFIKNRDNNIMAAEAAAEPIENQMPETQTQDFAKFTDDNNAESHDMVGWRDPSEFFQSERFQQQNRMLHVGTPIFSVSCSTPQVKLCIFHFLHRTQNNQHNCFSIFL